jgi:hypothetical protein
MRDALSEKERVQKPPHATVKWTFRDTADSEYATHYDGPWTVRVQDCDGDRSIWSIHHRDSDRELAEGEVCSAHTPRCDFDIAMDTALGCLAAMKAKRHEEDH